MWKLFAYEKTFGHGRKTLVEKNEKKKRKTGPKKKDSVPFCHNNKNYFMKATSTGRAPCWQPHKVSFSLCKYQP